MDGWEDDRGERLCPGCSFSLCMCVCLCRRQRMEGGGVEREVLRLSFTRPSPDLSAIRLHSTICRMPGI